MATSTDFVRHQTMTFTYTDSLGKISDRIATPAIVGPTYIVAFCHTRNQHRTFSFGRITNLQMSKLQLPIPS